MFIAISVVLAIVQYRSNVTFIAQLMGVSWGALAGAFCMIAGLVIVPVVSLLSKAPEKKLVDNIFSCYDRKVVVKAKDAIETEEI